MSKLTSYREKQNLTQDELAEKSGLSVRTIQRIEAGATLKGHSLNALAKALNVNIDELSEHVVESNKKDSSINFQLIKLINLSSLPFVFIPLANIAIPLAIMYGKSEFNSLTKQIVSVQIYWTIISAVVFLLSPFIPKLLGLEIRLTLSVLILALLTNVFIILRNTIEIDKNKRLYIKLNFSFL